VKNITAAKTIKAKKSCCDMACSRDLSGDLFQSFQAISSGDFGTAPGRFDSSMMAMAPITVSIFTTPSVSNFS
jgi:hypothetical protein